MATKGKGIGMHGISNKRVYRSIAFYGTIANAIDYTNIVVSGKTPLMLCGTSSAKITTSTADTKFFQIYVENTATSGDNRGIYLRQYLAGAGGGGEALRCFTTIDAVAAGTAHGAHISLNFVSTSNSGRLTGLGVAMRATLHIPDDASWTGGTLAAIQAEIYSDGSASDPDGLTELSYIRCINGGHADGISDVDDDAFLFSLQGMTAGSGSLYDTSASAATGDATLKIKIGGTTKYLLVADDAS